MLRRSFLAAMFGIGSLFGAAVVAASPRRGWRVPDEKKREKQFWVVPLAEITAIRYESLGNAWVCIVKCPEASKHCPHEEFLVTDFRGEVRRSGVSGCG